MISQYLFKGIDNIFSKNLAAPSKLPAKSFNREAIKSNLHSVVKKAYKNDKSDPQADTNLSKSRLRTILEKNKNAQLNSVIRRDHSRSPSPYQCISPQKHNIA